MVIRVDSRGRIALPKDIREKCGIKPGSHVLVEVRGIKEILLRVIERDPSEELAEPLADFKFTRQDRVKAVKLLLEEIG